MGYIGVEHLTGLVRGAYLTLVGSKLEERAKSCY